jgi:hypothetical protein
MECLPHHTYVTSNDHHAVRCDGPLKGCWVGVLGRVLNGGAKALHQYRCWKTAQGVLSTL